MLNEIIAELKEKIPTEWLEPIKEESFKDDILTLAVPDTYYAQKYETDYKSLIQNIVKAKTGKAVGLQFQIVASKLLAEPIIKDEKSKTPLMKGTKFNGSPYFKNPAELAKVAKKSEKTTKQIKDKKINIKNAELTPMPNKYGIENVVSFCLFNSKMFTYPNDKRKSAKVKIDIRFSNDTTKTYDLYRGKYDHNDKERGQLTTTHAKIFLAITHIWQEQNSRYVNNNDYYTVVETSMTELAKRLGYKAVSGADRKRLLQKTLDLIAYPMAISDGVRSYGFNILDSVYVYDIDDKDEKIRKNSTIRLCINSFIAKQFHDRKVIMRNPQCYKIKNPTAIKFLLYYDKRIVKGNSLRMNISEVANDLEIGTKQKSKVIDLLNTAFQELNGYELNDLYNLKAEIAKVGKEWIVIAERISKEKQQPLKALLA
ncbi:hypothetical protein AGMMS49953_09440 [Endomicrobiia bacterium]|nr:hypothetical protein AGMMS49953_09440 [Endomicrobiia bacterium]